MDIPQHPGARSPVFIFIRGNSSMAPNYAVLCKCRRVLNRVVSWRRTLILVGVIGAVTSLVFVSSASFDDRAGSKTPASDKRRQPEAPALRNPKTLARNRPPHQDPI
jgi:hypothetical protein